MTALFLPALDEVSSGIVPRRPACRVPCRMDSGGQFPGE